MPNKIIQLIGPMESKDSIDFLMDTIIIDGGLNRVKDTISKFKKVKEIVGDNDSNVTSHTMTKKLARDKDFSDLEYALQITKEKKYSNVILNGFLGGRRDHEFSNIASNLPVQSIYIDLSVFLTAFFNINQLSGIAIEIAAIE